MDVLLIATYELGRQSFGIASAAAWLEKAGARVKCADTSVEALPTDADVASARLIAFHVPMHTATRRAISIAERIIRINPSAHVCFFGLYAAMNEQRLRELGAKSILSGEFEADLVDVYRRLVAGADSGVSCRISSGRQHFLTPQRRSLPSLDQYARLRVVEGSERIVGYTEASRGCKHRCRHCPIVPIYDGRFRIVDRDVVLADVEQQIEAGASHITFGDPDFWNSRTHAHAIIEQLHRRHPDVTYDVTIKVEHLLRHATDLEILRRTGCLFITSAVESFDDHVLGLLDKGHTRADVLRVAGLVRDAGLVLVPTFVTFTPWMTLDGFLELLHVIEDLEWIEHVPPIQLSIRLLIPSGSRLLELPDVRALVGTFDPNALCHPWQHEDPRVDALHQELLHGVTTHTSRAEFFEWAWRRAEAHGARSCRVSRESRVPRFVPYLTEPWYC